MKTTTEEGFKDFVNEPTEQECEEGRKWALEYMSPKPDITDKIPIWLADEKIGYFPDDFQDGIRKESMEESVMLAGLKYAEDLVKETIRTAKLRQVKAWEKWVDAFRLRFEKRDENSDDGSPQWDNPKHLFIPGTYAVDYNATAQKLFGTLSKSEKFFVRGRKMVVVNDEGVLDIVDDNSLRSIPSDLFDKILAVNTQKNELTDATELVTKKANLSRDLCAALLKNEWLSLLPRIGTISLCPVVYEEAAGKPAIHRKGYLDHAGGIYITGGASIKPMSLKDATKIITGVLRDFRFTTEPDKTRAIAMMITPTLVQGGFIKDRIVGDFAESDHSQSGKGYRHDLIVAIYNDVAFLVTQRNGGTGSFDEFFGDALLKGRTFIRIDNLRDKLDSPSLESYFTAPFGSEFLARGFGKSGYVQAGRNMLQLSSNGLKGTRDISNRACIVRIRKQPGGYPFTKFPEGDMLDHIRANQGKFLGAVHAVVEEWIRKGKPKTTEGRHDFREWAQILDWIMSNIFGRKDMLDGHRAIQNRVSTPIIGVLRELAIEADRVGKLGEGMSATELIRFAEDCNVDILLGARGLDIDTRARSLGGQLAAAYKDAGGDILEIDEFKCVRITTRERVASGNYRDAKFYRFDRL